MTNTTKPALSASPVAQEPVAWREVEMMRLINLLRSEEGDSVTILCDNPDPRTEAENNAVVCNGGWTDWRDRRFTGVGLLDALSAAMIEYKRPKSVSDVTTPPATPAGVGVDEIARAFEAGALAVHNEWCDAIDRGESDPPFRPDFSEAAHDYALALLSRGSGSDQQRSHEEQSTQNI